MDAQSLFTYIKENTDTNGVFTASILPDDSEHLASFFFGTDDSFYFTGLIEDKPADELLQSLQTYLEDPNEQTKELLIQQITSTRIIEVYKSFLNDFSDLDYSTEVYELAQELFYSTNNKQVLKFALLLFSYESLLQIRETDKELWQDILTVAHCEEFTYFFIAAGYDDLHRLQSELWEIIFCCKNWGKIFALSEAEITTQEQKLWCIENALAIDVDYPLLAAKIALECDLEEFLRQPQLSYPMYKGAANIITNLFELQEHYTQEEVEESFHITSIDAFNLLNNFLHHSTMYADSLQQLMPVVMLENSLHKLLANDNWMLLPANQGHELIARCDSIIFQKDWHDDISNQLISPDGSINYTVCDFACRIGIDIWQDIFAYYCHNFREINLFYYLLKTEDSLQINALFKEIHKHLTYYLLDPRVLTLPMLYLRTHQGLSINIIRAFLEAKSDYALVMALGVLSSWDPDLLSDAICRSLQEARKYTEQENLIAQIDCLLYRAQGIYLDSSGFN